MSETNRDCKLSADKIPVRQFRQILLWPLALHIRPAPTSRTETGEAIARTVRSVSPPWAPVDDPSEHIALRPGGDRDAWNAGRYAEAVYFHEFVQDFLFAKRAPQAESAQNGDGAPFRLFQRTDIHRVEVTLAGTPARTLSLAVERLNLYFFCTGAACLVLEVACDEAPLLQLAGSGTRPLFLSDVQDFHEQFRRTYVPYAEPDLQPPGLVAREVTWLTGDGARFAFKIDQCVVRGMVHDYLNKTFHDDATGLDRRSPPLFEHWRRLLPGPKALLLASDHEDRTRRERWHATMDERMPTMLAVSVTGSGPNGSLEFMQRTSTEDLAKLCYADSAGGPSYLYDAPDPDTFLRSHAYSTYRESGTLFLFSGYAFVAYGAGWFFDAIVAPIHVPRHYFQIGLLVNLEIASLLSFSSRISRAVAEYNPTREPEERFEQMMHAIEDEYLRYIHRFRVTVASNHLQAREITELWRRHFRVKEIFDDLHGEITSATQYLFNRAASRSAMTVENLTKIGTCGLVAALTFSFLSIFFFSQAPSPHPFRQVSGDLAFFFLVSAAFSAVASVVVRRIWRGSDQAPPPQGVSGLARIIADFRRPRIPSADGAISRPLLIAAAVAGAAAVFFAVLWVFSCCWSSP